jgi:O-antigen/teichoic acid export membrane protein
MLLVTRYFTPEEQGYFYTFAGLMALQVFLEMGFSQCVVQFASHEFARLRFLPGGALEGEARARSRLISLGRLSLRWYGITAVLMVVAVGAAGYWFLAAKGASSVGWTWPWWSLCATAGVTLALLPLGALLEGCNQLSFLYGLRALAAVLGSVVLWISLWAGAGLFSGAFMGMATVLLTATAYRWRWRGLLGELSRPPQAETVSWRQELWPFQWRIALSWMSGYFLFNLFTPVLFFFHGPVVAGKMGMTLQLVNALAVVGQSWIVPQGPRFGVLITQRNYAEMDRLFSTATLRAVGVCLLGGLLLLPALAFVQRHFALGERFLDVASTAWLVLPAVTSQVISAQAVYLRAHKREPFLWVSLGNGLLTGAAVVVLGWQWGAAGAAAGYALLQVATLAWTTAIWRRCRREWHSEASTPVRQLI